ncbi:MAG: hypothetical protein WD897_01140 [Parcubacteria group bacterium]
MGAVLFALFIKVADMSLPASFPIPVEVPEDPAIAHPADPGRDNTPVQIAPVSVLMIGKIIWILAALAIVLPATTHLTRDCPETAGDHFPPNIVTEKPADGVPESHFLFLHL